MIREIENVNIYNVKRVRVRLSHEDILTLFTVPIELVPARSGSIFIPLAISIVSETTANAYGTATVINFGVPTSLNWYMQSTFADSQLDSADFGIFSKGFSGVSNNQTVVGFVNSALLFSTDADPTGGDPANYAIVTVYYTEEVTAL